MAFSQRKKRKPIYDASSDIPPTEEENAKMKKQAHNVVDYWLSQSDKSRFELFTKIKNKGITDDIANQVLDSYEEDGYVDDYNYATNFADSKIRYDRLGKRSISFKLKEKGISQEIIEEVLEKLDDEELEEQAKELALKKAQSNIRLDKQKRIQQIASLLARKGYSGSLVFKLAKEAVEEIQLDVEDEE